MKKNPLVILLSIIFVVINSGFVFGQSGTKVCGSTQAMKELYAQYPELIKEQELFLENNKQIMQTLDGRGATSYVIPIVFHIIHLYGAENISDAQVYDQIDILNEDFNAILNVSGIAPEFQALIGDAHFEFRLAEKDKSGNCTNGIEHIYSHETNQGNDFSKLNQWPRTKYLNIWVVNEIGTSGTVAGYAYKPAGTSGFGYWRDGIIILHDYVGSIGTGSPGNDHSLTHEIGHYLGLDHTWGGTNDPEVECGDDGINDTPETMGHSPGNCPAIDFTCSSAALDTTYDFALVNTTSGSTDPTPVPTITSTVTNSDGLILSGFVASNSLSANSADTAAMAFSNWDPGAANGETVYANLAGTLNTQKYYQFTITPVFGQAMTLTSISFTVSRDTAGCRTYSVRSSVNNYGSNITATISPANTDLSVQTGNIFFIKNDSTTFENGSKVTLSTGTTYANKRTPFTFRIYGWNAEDVSGTFVIDNVKISGTFGVVENIQNFMEYSYCNYMFTDDQVQFMEATLNSPVAYRSSLWQPANLTATGTEDTIPTLCTPIPDFKANRNYICQGSTVTFTDQSHRAPVTSRLWSFPNGTPSTSTASNPTVTFNSPWWQHVTLTVTNAAGTETITKGDYIYVSPPWTDFLGPYSESFEGNSAAWWIVDNPENNQGKWQVSNNAAYSGSKSIYLNNIISTTDPFYFGRLGGNKDAFISPAYNLSTTTSAILTFKYSCATRAAALDEITEVLKVYSSFNCGTTWSLRKTISSSALTNAGFWSNEFVPNNPSQWITATVSFIGIQAANVRFKFEYESSDLSNNIYIDDINVEGVLSTGEISSDLYALNVYPNPSASGIININYFNHGDDVNIWMTNVLGEKIYSALDKGSYGEKTITVNTESMSLAPGIYFVNISDGKKVQSAKVAVY